MAYLSSNSIFTSALNREYLAARKDLATKEAETECILKAKSGDVESRNKLFYKNISLLINMAVGSDKQVGGHFNEYDGLADDLIAAAALELDHAIEDFDVSTDNKFATFYKARAFNAMNKVMYSNHTIHIPENILKGNANKVAAGIVSDIPTMVSTSMRIHGDSEDDGCFLGDTLSDDKQDIFEEAVVAERSHLVSVMLDSLDEADRILIMKLFNDNDTSLRTVANDLGVSHECVRKNKERILASLRKKFSKFSTIIL